MEPRNKIPKKLQTLISEIEQSDILINDDLTRILPTLQLKAEDFWHLADFSHAPQYSYGRSKIYTGRNFEIFLMSWAQNDYTAIHNHGRSDWGAVCFLSEVHHRLYQYDGQSIVLADKSIIPTGAVVPVQGNLVHAMGNLTEQPSLSLHIYGSNFSIEEPDQTTRIFELEKKRIRFTSGEAFLDGIECFGKPSIDVTTNEETLLDYLGIISPFYEKGGNAGISAYIKSVIQDPSVYFNL
ncbi:MAG: cysteine dioxygenase family protein [Prolixibacteraceae bacterium]